MTWEEESFEQEEPDEGDDFSSQHRFHLALPWYIDKENRAGRMTSAVIYGRQGQGKSAYAINVLKELYPGNDWRDFILFDAREVVDMIKRLKREDRWVPAIVIDDASRVFYYMNYAHRAVKDALNWLAWARTRVGAVLFTTPQTGLLVKKVMTFEGMLIGKVVRTSGHSKWGRSIVLYQNSLTPWNHRFLKEVMRDSFSARLPDDDYSWYKPKRASYLDRTTDELGD